MSGREGGREGGRKGGFEYMHNMKKGMSGWLGEGRMNAERVRQIKGRG